jgi:hypothetical protein
MWTPPADHPLRRLFAGLTEHTFMEAIGLADPPLTDYVSDMLSRFVCMDAIYQMRGAEGRRLEEVAGMVLEAEQMPPKGRTRREVHRHIGDFTLFWTGLYPEQLKRLRSPMTRDCFIDYCEQGKLSYRIASGFEADDSPVLRRLSEEYELVAYGLNQVRREWEKHRAA